jgi:hypothetical protein
MVCVSSMISSAPYFMRQLAEAIVKPGSGRTMQELVITGSVRIAATSPLASAASTPARSLNSQQTAVCVRSPPGPEGPAC